jgi:hypothetical protein
MPLVSSNPPPTNQPTDQPTDTQAPAKPKTPYGEMLQYYLKMQPQLFKSAVEQQLLRLRDERDAKDAATAAAQLELPPPDATAAPPRHPEVDEAAAADAGVGRSAGDMVLYRRMEEVRAREVRATLEDLMYGE